MELKVKNDMTSLELTEQINFFRKKEGKKTRLEHFNLLNVIRDEFEEEINALKIQAVEYRDKKGEKRPMFILTLSQAKQVLVRESKFVRRAIIQYIEKLEQALHSQATLPPTSSSVMIPLNKACHWAKIQELSEEADEVRDKAYKKLTALTKALVSVSDDIDNLSRIVFLTEEAIKEIEK